MSSLDFPRNCWAFPTHKQRQEYIPFETRQKLREPHAAGASAHHHAKPVCKCVQAAAIPWTLHKTLDISDAGTGAWPAADPPSGSQISVRSLLPCKGREEFLGQSGQQRHQTSHKTWFMCSKLQAWQCEEQQAPAEVYGLIPGNRFPWTQEHPQASILKKSRVFISG